MRIWPTRRGTSRPFMRNGSDDTSLRGDGHFMNPMSAPTVSVIISTYNRPALLTRAIDSVLAQTYAAFELLVIDDRGTPDTQSVVRDIMKRDPRVSYFPNEIRSGLMENKNKGVRLSSAHSRYVAFLDDDDAYLPHFLERTIATLAGHPDAVAACTDCELRHQDGTFIKRYHCERSIFWRASLGNGSVVRKDVFTHFNIWFDKDAMFEDLDFGVRALKDHTWIGIPEVLRVYYRYHSQAGESMSTMYTSKTPQSAFEYFIEKNGWIYRSAGNEAIAWIHALTGKMMVRAGHVRAGRRHLYVALRHDFHFSYLAYYLTALIFPGAFARQSLVIFKNKAVGMLRL